MHFHALTSAALLAGCAIVHAGDHAGNYSTATTGDAISFQVAVNFRNGFKGFNLRDTSDASVWTFNVGRVNLHFPALRADALALSGASRIKQILRSCHGCALSSSSQSCQFIGHSGNISLPSGRVGKKCSANPATIRTSRPGALPVHQERPSPVFSQMSK